MDRHKEQEDLYVHFVWTFEEPTANTSLLRNSL